MKKLLALLILSFLICLSANASSLKIVALVNGDIVSSEDYQSRIKSFMMSTQIPYNAQTKNMINQKVLNSAIDEKLKIQEAKKQGISIDETEIQGQIRNIEKNNKMALGEMKKALLANGVSEETFKEQIKSDLAWLRVVRKKYYQEGTPTQKEIDTMLKEASEDFNTPKYQVSEIFIKKDKAKNLTDLVYNLRNDPRFELYAMQFSDSPSAANGGNLGWINSGQLASML